MNSIKFYNSFIIKSYFLSNFLIRNTKNIIKLNGIKIKIFFLITTKINYVTNFLVFSILTKTNSFFLKGLKNYKENKINLSSLIFFLNKKKYIFLSEFLNLFLIENLDSIKRLKKSPNVINTLILNKFLNSLLIDKIYELNCVLRNSQQIIIYLSFFSKKKIDMQSFFLFNILVNSKKIPICF